MRAACSAAFPERLPSRDLPPNSGTTLIPTPDGKDLIEVPPAPPTTDVGDPQGHEEAAKLKAAIEKAYKAQAVGVIVGEPKIGPTIIAFDVRAPLRGSIKRLDSSSHDVIHQLQAMHGAHANYVPLNGSRKFEVARRVPRKVLLPTLLAREEKYLRERPGRFIIGEQVTGDVVCGDLSEPSSCHVLVAGATGSGKSVLLRSIIASMAHYHGPDAIRFTLVDPKRVSFAPFRSKLSAHLAHPILYDVDQAIEVLDGLVQDMEDRYEAFAREAVEDIDDYNETVEPTKRIARQVVVVDEFADLLAIKTHRETFLGIVQRLAAKARAAGIHLILATQYPNKNTVPGIIKNNLTGRIALKVPSVVASQIMLDRKGAESLLGRGDLYADLGRDLVRAQSPFLEL